MHAYESQTARNALVETFNRSSTNRSLTPFTDSTNGATGYTALEEGICHVQDYAFSIPKFKQIVSGTSSASAASASGPLVSPRLITAGGVESEEEERLLQYLALTAGSVMAETKKASLPPPSRGKWEIWEEWGRGLWRGGQEDEEEEEPQGQAVADGEEEGGRDGDELGQGSYRLGRKFEGGGQGEIWRAYKVRGGRFMMMKR